MRTMERIMDEADDDDGRRPGDGATAVVARAAQTSSTRAPGSFITITGVTVG